MARAKARVGTGVMARVGAGVVARAGAGVVARAVGLLLLPLLMLFTLHLLLHSSVAVVLFLLSRAQCGDHFFFFRCTISASHHKSECM